MSGFTLKTAHKKEIVCEKEFSMKHQTNLGSPQPSGDFPSPNLAVFWQISTPLPPIKVGGFTQWPPTRSREGGAHCCKKISIFLEYRPLCFSKLVKFHTCLYYKKQEKNMITYSRRFTFLGYMLMCGWKVLNAEKEAFYRLIKGQKSSAI